MTLAIHTALLWFAALLYSAVVIGIGSVLAILLVMERAGATRHTHTSLPIDPNRYKNANSNRGRVTN